GAAPCANPARRAFAAGFDRTEMEGEARLLREIDGVVEHHDAAMPDHAASCRERFIINRHVKQAGWPIGTKRPAHLHRAHRAPGVGAAAELFDHFAQREAECAFDQTAALDIARKLQRHRAARTAHAEIAIKTGALLQNHRNSGERDYIVDHRRFAEQACDGRQRWFEANLAALPFKAFQQRGFFAADIRPGAEPRLEIEIALASENAAAEQLAFTRYLDGTSELPERMRIFGTNIDET